MGFPKEKEMEEETMGNHWVVARFICVEVYNYCFIGNTENRGPH